MSRAVDVAVRALLVAAYVALTVLAFASDSGPRVFWTMLLPLLPLAIVLGGFATWRRVCPLAFWGELGRALHRGGRRMPRAFEAWIFPATFALLFAMLVLRLCATNGDGRWLGGLLVALGAAALVTNLLFTGKTWCNYLCPVGLVEAIYTEPALSRGNSPCARCTACKRNCPDINQENGYWKDVDGRRFAYYAFPGLVLGFYGYYWLRAGDWEAYFDGRWTRAPADALAPGFFFAPGVPTVAAAALTLVAFSAASFALFALAERLTLRLVPDAERRRHVLYALAAFAAFNLFYFFAGAPTLRQLPGGARLAGFVAPFVATLVLARRWPRTRERFLQERGATKLVRAWPFAEPAPAEPAAVFAFYRANTQAHEKNLGAYRGILREMIQEGLATRDELRLLAQVRGQLGISEREHDKVVAELSAGERRLFENPPDAAAHLQLQGYQRALAAALLHRASAEELEQLRLDFSIDPATHAEALGRVRGGELATRARQLAARAAALDADLRALNDLPGPGAELARCSLTHERDAALTRARELLPDLPPASPDSSPARPLEVLHRLAAAPDAYQRAGAQVALADLAQPPHPGTPDRKDGTNTRSPHPGTPDRKDGTNTQTAPAPEIARSTVEKMILLRRVSVFADLEPAVLHELCALSSEETVAPPALVCKEGEPGDELFVILDGAVAIVAGEREIALRRAGDVIGELAVIDGEPRSATARPHDGPVRLLRIDGRAFRERLLHRPDVSAKVLTTLARRLRERQ